MTAAYEQPVDRGFRLVDAEVAGAHGVVQVPAEAGMGRRHLLDRAPDPPGHGGSRALGRAAEAARPAAQADGAGERVDELIELLARPLRPSEIVRRVGVVDLALQLHGTRADLAAGAVVEHDVAGRRLGRAIGQLQAVDLDAGLRQQARQVGEPLDLDEAHGLALERRRPQLAVPAEHGPRRGRRTDGARRLGLGAVVPVLVEDETHAPAEMDHVAVTEHARRGHRLVAAEGAVLALEVLDGGAALADDDARVAARQAAGRDADRRVVAAADDVLAVGQRPLAPVVDDDRRRGRRGRRHRVRLIESPRPASGRILPRPAG